MSTYTDAEYLDAVRAADAPSIARWRTSTCPECGDLLRTDGVDASGHVTVNGAVVIGCEGYYVISPAALGLPLNGWDDWTADYEDFEECEVHGEVHALAWGSFSGYAGGSCSWVKLSCGCTLVDEQADIAAAR